MKMTAKTTVENIQGLETKATCRGFEITLDEPEESGGSNKGMNPIEALLSALGCCQTIALKTFAMQQGVQIDSVRMEVEGDIDTDGFMGANPDVRCGLQDIRMKVYIKAPDKEAAKKLADLAAERCPVEDCLVNPVPVTRTELVVE